jgi:hypothetical protein
MQQGITFAAENAESSLGISHRKNQYAITLQEDCIVAFYNHFCAYQLSQHDLAVHSHFEMEAEMLEIGPVRLTGVPGGGLWGLGGEH